jgi:hypothetical protein
MLDLEGITFLQDTATIVFAKPVRHEQRVITRRVAFPSYEAAVVALVNERLGMEHKLEWEFPAHVDGRDTTMKIEKAWRPTSIVRKRVIDHCNVLTTKYPQETVNAPQRPT